jgi:4-azaleucine resistance transporter AzlC
MAGYVAIGIPCGIMEAAVGVPAWACFVVSASFYTGSGQFMFSNMVMAGLTPATIIASIALVHTRQILYSAAFAPFFSGTNRLLTLLFSATVTDETFGVNLDKFTRGELGWGPREAFAINVESMLAWASGNFVGALVGPLLNIPTDVTSFAMTGIFICLLVGQQMNRAAWVALASSAATVLLCKLVGLANMAVFVGAVVGVVAGTLVGEVGREGDDGRSDPKGEPGDAATGAPSDQQGAERGETA